MNVAASDDQQRWLAAGVGAVVIVGVFAALIQAPRAGEPAARSTSRPVELRRVAADDLVQSEEAALRDLTPLFLPTPWNASAAKLPQREPGRTFFDREPERFAFGEAGWTFERNLPPVVTLNGKTLAAAKPLDVLEANNPAPVLAGFGRSEISVVPLEPRGGFVEIVATETGQRVLALELQADARPPTDAMWGPLEFLAAVEPAGLVAPLNLTARSGVEEVDAFFRAYLARTFRLGERLTPGFYRITVAP